MARNDFADAVQGSSSWVRAALLEVNRLEQLLESK